MKAIIFENYGGPEVLQYVDLPKPTPESDEVLIKIQAASLNAADWHIMRGKPYFMRLTFGLTKPKYNRFGCDVAGIIEAVGEGVNEFKAGDEVFADVSGDFQGFGACSEYLCIKASQLVRKPKALSFKEAASVPLAGVSALQGLRKGAIKKGDNVLIVGASGGVGTYAVQLAKVMGAHVTAVCSTSKLEMVRSLGADEVIDYKKQDFTEMPEKYDFIFAVNGSRPLTDFKKVLKPKGRYVMCGGSNRQIFEVLFFGWFHSRKNGQSFTPVIAKYAKSDLAYLADLANQGKIKPMIDREYALCETAKGMAYLEEGHAVGKVVIEVA
jgi:NADPH:quinone reductase-like Zn-dependent oxidoreductase